MAELYLSTVSPVKPIMYHDYFGFREPPFHITPNPRFFYTNPGYQETYAALRYGIHARKGFIVVTGEVGTGKTTLLRRLMLDIQRTESVSYFQHTTLSFDEILDWICCDFGLAIEPTGRRLEKINKLKTFLLARLEEGKTGVVLIDEAHNLSDEVLENLRLLSNLETDNERLFQIVLVGQQELRPKLAQPTLRQLTQRIAIQCQLDCLKAHEVGPFIDFRLQTAGYDKPGLFAPEAIRRIAVYTKGIPRIINVMCDNALLIAYTSGQKTVSASIVEEVAADLNLSSASGQLEGQLSQQDLDKQENLDRPIQPHVHAAQHSRAPESGEELAAQHKRHTERAQPHNTSRRRHHPDISRRVPRPSWRFFRVGVGALAVLLFLGAVGAAIYPDTPDTEQQTALLPGSEKKEQLFTTPPQPAAQETFGAEQPDVSSSGAASLEQSHMSSPPQNGLATSVSSSAHQPPRPAPTQPDSQAESRVLIVKPGATLSSMVSQVYGIYDILTLDLIKEFNPHIDNFDHIRVGQKITFPPVTRATLEREQADGSYRLILAAFTHSNDADSYAQDVRRQGYAAHVIPRQLTPTRSAYRVEVGGLDNLDEVDEAWALVKSVSSSTQPHASLRPVKEARAWY